MTLAPLVQYPGMNRFVLDWLAGNPKATQFLPHVPRPDPSPSSRLGMTAVIEALEASNKRWSSNIGDELRRWSSGKTSTIVTGQQVGLAGGPLYTLTKLATAIQLKRQLAAKGQAATIFFWLASEDHDYAEAATLHVPVSGGQMDLLTIRPRIVDSRHAVGPMPLPEEEIRQLLDALKVPRPSWLREGITFTDSFAELLASTFSGEPIVFVDSLLPELRRTGAPLFEAIMSRWTDLQRAITKRSSELRDAGYECQVGPRENGLYTLLFRLDKEMQRHMIEHAEPVGDTASLSTSAITRPLLQDFVLRPDVFIGGPAEVAYYAQIAPFHELLGIPMPRVSLRGHVLVAPRRVLRAAERHGIDPQNAFRSPDQILAEREAPGVAEINAIAERARKKLSEDIAKIGEIALPAEHALARAINRSIGHIEYHFNKLTERAIRGLARKDRERYLAAKELVSTLYPDRHVQDRVVSWFALWTKYGETMLPAIVDNAFADDANFRIASV